MAYLRAVCPKSISANYGELRDYADDKYNLNKSHFTLNWLVASVVYSSLDALQVTTTNIFHKLHLTELPARHLDNTYANDNQVQDAFFGVYIEVFTWGVGRYLKALKPVAAAADDVAGEVVEEGLDITLRLQTIVTETAKEVDALGIEAFTINQRKALDKYPKLWGAFRGNRIDVRVREIVSQDPVLNHLLGNYSKGPDFVDPVTGQWWDMTTQGQWRNHVKKYGTNGTLLDTHY